MIHLGSCTFSSPLINAAAPFCKTLTDVKKLCATKIGGIVIGSYTVEPRYKNKGRSVVSVLENSYLNSMGLPNFGLEKLKVELPKMLKETRKVGKPLIVNIAGTKGEDDYIELAEVSLTSGAEFVELNFGCPNVWDRGDQKRIVSYDLRFVKSVLKQLEKQLGASQKIIVKCSPLADPFMIRKYCEVVSEFRCVVAVSSTNTYPNARYIDGRRGSLTATNGFGGLSGDALFPVSLGQAAQLKMCLPKRIKVIGIGGVSTGEQLFEMLKYADLAGCATTVVKEGVGSLDRIIDEYMKI